MEDFKLDDKLKICPRVAMFCYNLGVTILPPISKEMENRTSNIFITELWFSAYKPIKKRRERVRSY